MAIQSMQLDPNAAPPEDSPRNIRNETGSGLVAGDLLYVSGWNETESRFLVTKASNATLGARAALVMRASLATVTNGIAYRTYRLTGQVTTGSSVGAPVYLSTAGGWTLTAPTAAGAFRQVVGRVAIVHASAGVIEFDLMNQPVEAVGSNELQDSAVATAKIAATAVDDGKIAAGAIKTKLGAETDGNKLVSASLAAAAGVTNAQVAAGQAKANLDAMTDTTRGYIKTDPAATEFKVVSVQRKADGKLEAKYDDVAV